MENIKEDLALLAGLQIILWVRTEQNEKKGFENKGLAKVWSLPFLVHELCLYVPFPAEYQASQNAMT